MLFGRICRAWRRALRLGDQGNVAITFALVLIPLLGFVALAIDSLQGFLVEDRLQKSLDAAGLAAGRVTEDVDLAAEAQQVFEANFAAGNKQVAVDTLKIAVNEEEGTISLAADATLPTAFMRALGQKTLSIGASTVINREIRQMELVLVMDNTGSMVGQPIADEIAGAKMLIDNVYGNAESHENLLVGLVPYTAAVNIGSWRTDWLVSTDKVFQTPNPFAVSVNKWKGCVMARPYPFDRNDDPPSVKKFESFLYPADYGDPSKNIKADNPWTLPLKEKVTDGNNGTGPNLGCGSPPILPLVHEKSKVIAEINKMGAWHRGGTTSNLGLVWGWAVLSPRWRGLWGGDTPADRPLDYKSALSDKVIVLLTDGNNEVYDHNSDKLPRGSDFTAYGYLYDMLDDSGNKTITSIAKGNELLDKRMAGMCEDIKKNGVIIYAITYGSKPDAATQTLFGKCATSPDYYYHAPDGAKMKSVFKKIGRQLGNLRIAH
jgi:Flp pilus assembly protein TadG